MAYAFGHLIFAWILAKGYEIFSKKKLSHLTWGFLLLGAILPDADYLMDWIFGTQIHRTITHSLLFLVIISVLVYLFVRIFKSKKVSKELSFAIGIGILCHLILDMFAAPGINLLWPSKLFISYFSAGYYSISSIIANSNTLEYMKSAWSRAILDMALGVIWLAFIWYRRRIKF